MITLTPPTKMWHSLTLRRSLILSMLFGIPNGLTTATYYRFLTHDGHLSDLQMSQVNLVFFTMLFLLEVPTGVIADLFGRKNAVILSTIFLAIGSYIYGRSHSFGWFALSEAILAVYSSLISGAFDAWLNDRLAGEGYDRTEMKPMFATISIAGKVTSAFAALVGAQVAQRYGLGSPFLVESGVGVIALFAVTFLMQEAKYVPRTLKENVEKVKKGLLYSRKHPVVQFLVVTGVISVVAFQALNMYWPKFFGPILGGDIMLGKVGFMLNIAVLIGFLRSSRFNSDTGAQRALTGCYMGISLCVLATALTRNMPLVSVAFFFIHEIGRGLLDGIRRGYANEAIELDEERATVSSCASLGRDLGGMIGLPLMGSVIMHISVAGTWIFAALLLGVGTLISARIFRAK